LIGIDSNFFKCLNPKFEDEVTPARKAHNLKHITMLGGDSKRKSEDGFILICPKVDGRIINLRKK